MRLIYQYYLRKISKKNCGLVIDSLRSRVATPLTSSTKFRGQKLPTGIIFKFITTSRPVEAWLQMMEKNIYKASHRKALKSPIELWMVIGGVGAGKSHIKEYLLGTLSNFSYTSTLELRIDNLKTASTVDDILLLILMHSKSHLDAICEKISSEGGTEGLREKLEENFIDDEFIDSLFEYERSRRLLRNSHKSFEEFLNNVDPQIYLSLMKLSKIYLGIKEIFLFIDEFEDLQSITPTRQESFIESIRSFYDVVASTLPDPEFPSLKIIILCTLSYWNEIHRDTRFRALETRSEPFEIFPLVEDEIITMAEKLFSIYKKSGYPMYWSKFDVTKLPAFLVKVASEGKEPLTPRFVIKQIINIIENPSDEYLSYIKLSQ